VEWLVGQEAASTGAREVYSGTVLLLLLPILSVESVLLGGSEGRGPFALLDQ
jgi:hypothetical protein